MKIMQQPIAERFVTFNAVANRLAITTTELCVLVVRGTLPRPIRIAGRLKFFKSDIDGFLANLRYQRDRKSSFKR
jgi:predicted DNA-binding transcriptional regulator AlpA